MAYQRQWLIILIRVNHFQFTSLLSASSAGFTCKRAIAMEEQSSKTVKKIIVHMKLQYKHANR